MDKNNKDITQATLVFWKKHTDTELSDQDAIEMITNVSGFFEVLQEWDRKLYTENNDI